MQHSAEAEQHHVQRARRPMDALCERRDLLRCDEAMMVRQVPERIGDHACIEARGGHIWAAPLSMLHAWRLNASRHDQVMRLDDAPDARRLHALAVVRNRGRLCMQIEAAIEADGACHQADCL